MRTPKRVCPNHYEDVEPELILDWELINASNSEPEYFAKLVAKYGRTHR